MITEKEAFALLLQACPGIGPTWQEHLRDWKGKPAGYYNDMAVFVYYVANAYGIGKREELTPLFDVIERLIVEGGDEVRGLAIVGFLETLQTFASNQDFGAKVFEPWLGPRSRRAWDEIESQWAGKSSLMDVIREERKGDSTDEPPKTGD